MRRRDRPPHAAIRASRPWALVVRASAFVRKELVEIARQPRLLGLIVVGPFLLLLLFGAGYRNDDLRMRTVFVGPAGSFYEDALAEGREALEQFVEVAGFSPDRPQAEAQLAAGEVDAVVVFPADALDVVLGGQRAEITILHDKIDPIQQTAVAIGARLAVQEVNAQVVAAIIGDAPVATRPFEAALAEVRRHGTDVAAAAAADDQAAAARAAGPLAAAAGSAQALIAVTDDVLRRLGAEDDAGRQDALRALESIRSDADAIAAGTDADLADRSARITTGLEQLAAAPELATLDPEVLVRPFEAVTESVVPGRVEPIDFFAPSALALLLQHLAMTFAGLSLVRDRQLGLFELLRVGPLSAWEIVSGKTMAYLLVGMLVGIGLVEAAVHLLGVPLLGEIWWVLVAFALVLLASLALGTLISLVSRSETQAVQWAMLTLLAGLFFSGFVLALDRLTYPVRTISWLLPVTYGIRLLHDVMLRGLAPSRTDLAGLAALVVGYGGLAVLLLRRQLRTG